MSNPSSIKTIYTFEVETTNGDAKTKTLFAFKKPSRAEREDADSWRAGWWNKYLEKGLMPEALLQKRYDNDGGTFNNSQKAEIEDIRAQLLEKTLEQEKAMLGTDLILRGQLTNEVLNLRERFIRLQQSREVFFQNTAEAKARTKLIEWLILHLTYWRSDVNAPWMPFFAGDTDEARYEALERLEEAEDPIYIAARDQLTFVAALFVSLNGNLKKEDIDAFLAPALAAASEAAAAVTPATDVSASESQPAS